VSEKDYDTTLAHIAGHIASWMLTSNVDDTDHDDLDWVARRSVRLAALIIQECREIAKGPK
jgi:hypothetical protein